MKATWVLPDGSEVEREVSDGQNLMQAAVSAGIPAVTGDCGGSLSCATCHVFVDPGWAVRAGEVGDFEEAMLDATEVERSATSRLSCQIVMSAALDGIRLKVPVA